MILNKGMDATLEPAYFARTSSAGGTNSERIDKLEEQQVTTTLKLAELTEKVNSMEASDEGRDKLLDEISKNLNSLFETETTQNERLDSVDNKIKELETGMTPISNEFIENLNFTEEG